MSFQELELKEKMRKSSTIIYVQLVVGAIRMVFGALIGNESDAHFPAYPLEAIILDSILLTLGFIAAGKLKQASRGWARYIVFAYLLDLLGTALSSSLPILLIKIAVAFFVFKGVIAVFQYHNAAHETKDKPKPVSIRKIAKVTSLILGGFVGACFIAFFILFWVFEDSVVDGSNLPVEHQVQLRQQGVLGDDEPIDLFYGNSLLGLDGDFYLITKQKLVLNSESLGEEPVTINYSEISNLYCERNDNQSLTFTLVELHDGSGYVLELPCADSSDQKFLIPMFAYYDSAMAQATPASSI